jgi:hypothetical protein
MISEYLLAALFAGPPLLWSAFFIYCWIAFRGERKIHSAEFTRRTPVQSPARNATISDPTNEDP